jgi:hypothetical protein
MFIKRRFFYALAILTLASGTQNIHAQRIQSQADPFNNGDRVCFIGNSITHGGSYHSLIYLFYLTRFPEQRIDVYNCGISGDNVKGALNRFNEDIAVHKSTVATIKLGTNDINRSWYVNSTPEKEAEKLKANARYKSNMEELVRKLDSMQTKIIFLTPAYYEEKPMSDSTIALGLNKGFEKYGLFLDSLSRKYKCGIVDFHYMMDSISMARQKIDPDFTLISLDRVHPEYSGHFVMAYSFLKALQISPFVSNTVIDTKRKKVLEAINCTISGLKISRNEISFQNLEKSLPFPVSAYPADTTLVPFTHWFNREILQVKGLSPDKKYMLTIDSIRIAEFTGKQLQSGINLALLPSTPQAAQASEITVLNEKRRQIALAYRDLKFVEFKVLTPEELKLSKDQLNELLAQRLKSYEDKSYHEYFKRQFTNYMKNAGKQNDYLIEIDQLVNEIYKLNKPVLHHYNLTRIN